MSSNGLESSRSAAVARRAFLSKLASLAATGAVSAAVGGCEAFRTTADGITADPSQDDRASVTGPLRDRAAEGGLLYGAATFSRALNDDPVFAERFAQECAMLVPEFEMKWDSTHPEPTRFDFTLSDRLAAFARDHRLLLRGHTLVWDQALPTWFPSIVNRTNAEQILLEHIAAVAGRYRGQIHSWDVVNEVVNPLDGRLDGLRKTPWLDLLGPHYLDLAFHATAEADPSAMLVLNEYGLDYDTAEDERRRTAVLRLLDDMMSRGVPIHALGVQAHLRAQEQRFSARKLTNFFYEIRARGLNILITELDIADQGLPVDPTQRDQIVARAYEEYLSAALSEPAVIAVLTWGLSDRYTWLSSYSPRSDGAPVRPLPLDLQLKPKAAYSALARAFDRAPTRRAAYTAA